MRSPARSGLPLSVVLSLLLPSSAIAVQPRFDLATPSGSPFPSDRFTVADPAQVTDRRVDLPLPDCGAPPSSDCEDLALLNELDGFNLLPRVAIPFDGDVDFASATRDSVFLLRAGTPASERVEVEEILWDPATRTLHGRAATVLDQHARYLVVVTRALLDPSGRPVDASAEFQRFRHDLNLGQTKDETLKAYRKELLDALDALRSAGIDPDDVAVASAFTTMSGTALVERAREALQGAPAPRADFDLLDAGAPGQWTVFPIADLTRLAVNQEIDTGTSPPPPLTTADLTASRLALVRGGEVATLALGRYESPSYLDRATGSFGPLPGTRALPAARGTTTVYFNLLVPAERADRPRPGSGWPVVVFAYGSGDSKNGAPFNVAKVLAAHGLATLSINAVGHGRGARTTLTVGTSSRGVLTVPSPGRGVDADGNGQIAPTEGFDAKPPRDLTRTRDGAAQTAIDLLQLVRVIRGGVDADGDGAADLDPDRIYLLGFSTGAGIAAAVHVVEPAIRASAFTSPGFTSQGPGLSPLTRANFGAYLAGRSPPLANGGGVTAIDQVPVGPPLFDENVVWRYEGAVPAGGVPGARVPKQNEVPGALAIQEVFERMAWVAQGGGGVAPWPMFRSRPLDGVPARPILAQFARGDQQVANPTTTRYLRSGDVADRATYVLFGALGTFKNPHTLLLRTDSADPRLRAVAAALQEQLAAFFASDGATPAPPPETPTTPFEFPVATLPETFNYIP